MGTDQGAIRVDDTLVIPPSELTWRFSRSSGPGGQSVNTTDSRVQLTWAFAGSEVLSPGQLRRLEARLGSRGAGGTLTVTAHEERSQWQNRSAARRRMVQVVRTALAPPPRPRRASTPTRTARERRIADKKRRGALKRDRGVPGADD